MILRLKRGKMVFSIALSLFLIGILVVPVPAFPQNPVHIDSLGYPGRVTVIAGPQYKKSSFHQWLWGKHYRNDWITPVQLGVIRLDTIYGGLIPYEQGGGRQSKTLRLQDANKKEYVLRSIDKTYGKALPEILRGGFIERIINDQVSTAEPYSALIIAPMAEAAKIYHTNPIIGYLPSQKALGEFNKDMADQLYLLEQRPDENWEEADNFGNSKKIVGTDKMLLKITEESDNRVDQLIYVRSRLFDIFIGDWGRQEDQWRWGGIEDDGKTTYLAIPRDRDQAFTKLDGILLGPVTGAAHLETFGPAIRDVNGFNYPARNLDRRVANEPVKAQWIAIAQELQQLLTDRVIEKGVKQLPPEVFAISGNEIITKLRSRRDHLHEYAATYYAFLAKEVDVTGTKEDELFEIKRLNDHETLVRIYDLDKERKPRKKPYYERVFQTSETREIRLYGLEGQDQYNLEDAATNKTTVRIIGGPGKDEYTLASRGQTIIYDNSENYFTRTENSKKHLSPNPFIHNYEYAAFNYDSKGISPVLFYNSQDHIYAGLHYHFEKQQWRKYPFGFKHEIGIDYSFTEKAPSVTYEGLYKELIGRWDLVLFANYDHIRWANFYGIGNETKMMTAQRDFHRVRTREFIGSAGIVRKFAQYNTVALTGFYQTIRVVNDKGRFLTDHFLIPYSFETRKYAGVKLEYTYRKLDNGILPTRGINFTAGADFAQNLAQPDSNVIHYSSVVNFFLPLSGSFILSLKAGGASLSGKPEFYQMSRLGGGKTLRGFRKYRFYGKSMAYNQNELQFVKNVRSFLFNGKLGLLGFYDIGRVWQPGEDSDQWHTGYGGGIIIVPFNKIGIAAMYGFGKDGKDFTLRISKSF
jgi:hypothetical protein